MPQVTGSNIAGHFPISAQIGAQHTPPVIAGNSPVSYAVPAPAALTINGFVSPKIDVRQHDLRTIADLINLNIGIFAGVVASLDRYGRLILSSSNAIVIGGDAGVRAALGV
jgi:hypothetical protein